jgi:hypothetical protein
VVDLGKSTNRPGERAACPSGCVGCPLRQRCTTAADGRSMSIHPHEQLLRAARAPQFKQDYPTRSSVERIIARLAPRRRAHEPKIG